MTWPARTWVPGETVTAALLNAYVRDPVTDLLAGGIAIASQAANDLLFCSSASQVARLAAVSSRTPRFNGSAWEMFNMAGQPGWPVGSIYESVVSTNPATLFGFGTWVAFGPGRVVASIDSSQIEFDTVEGTGGAKTVTLGTSQLPVHTHVQDAHTHTQNSHNHTQNAHVHDVNGLGGTNSVSNLETDEGVADNAGTKSTTSVAAVNQSTAATNNATTATNQSTGGFDAHTNLQPYIVVFRWKRVA